jgi:Ca-activated chloride channel family protein
MTRTIATFDERTPDADASLRAGFGALETDRGRLPLVALDVQARISDVTGEMTVRQTFRNALDEPLEATYLFPLPDRAAVTRFQMHVAGRTIDGDLKERGEAREEYDRAIQQGHRAAIAEEDRSGVFNLRVGNIPPREEATVELTLVGPLSVSDGEATFRFPLVVAPRYTPGIPLDGPSVGAGVTPDTDEVPDASRVTPPVLLPGFPNPVRLSLEVQLDAVAVAADQATWRERVKSSLHSTITEEGPPWTIRLQPEERLNRDFILRFPVAAASIATSLRVSPAAGGKAGVFALTLLPPVMRDVQPKPREIVFLLDRSGSMRGWKMVAARRALGRMIDTLLDHDRFAVLAFDSVVERPPHANGGFVSGTNRQRWETLEWLGGIDSRGGTEMGPAISEALRLFTQREARTEQILVLVTDGQVTGEDAMLRQLGKAAGVKPRIFTVGIDRAVNAGFLKRLADAGRGACELVESEDRLDEAMSRIHRLIGTPVLTQVRLEPVNADWVSDSLAPKRLPDLFADRPVMIHGRHLAADGAMRLRIHGLDAAGKPWCEEVTGREAPAPMLLSTWGRALVRDLEDEYASGGSRNPQQLVQKIVEVSLESHVLSRSTAYVAVDQAEVIDQGETLQKIVQPVEMPQAWAMAAPRARSFGAVAAGGMATLFRKMRAAPPDDDLLCGLDDSDSADSLLQEFTDTAIDFSDSEPPLSESGPVNEDNPAIARLVQLVMTEALQLGATEIRIEPLVDRIRVQYRIQDKLVDRETPPLRLLDALVGRILKLANLDPAQRHSPQQGRLSFVSNSISYIWNVSTSTTSFGTSIVMTLDSQSAKGSQKQSKEKPRRKRFWT